ncbi:S-adenosyl methyltransferase [Streptomyces sp. DvalAA-14]|uniref:SAM-dependent methyltransferase n=1 Tax=unclassified Streptomyces TaxID=2593676 RepID=UPI00081B3304|nr:MULTISPECIES: SAM-dependent methyltransferase [unclassified Streptomyces]MYS22435.1 SAM-dependent methyltransferase [Streptomyces sp. SID4948]SCE16123.1 S-adenosyl methyltransferase [Streptomyces sp. DvalAA-14]
MSDDMAWTRRPAQYEAPQIDTGVPHSARVYDFILGGKDNYAPDREAAEQMLAGWPSLRVSMRENRTFMHRAVRFLAEQGIDQFLDIGTGIPTSPNLHEIAQGVLPSARVVYVDNDPIVLAHAGARLNSTPEGRIAYLHADLRDPEAIVRTPELTDTLDLSRPVALSIIAVLQFITDDQQAYRLVKQYLDLLPAGSWLVLSTVTVDSSPEPIGEVVAEYTKRGMPARNRTKAEVEQFFAGLDLVEPGVVLVHSWRPAPGTEGDVLDSEVAMYGGVARKA